MVLNYVQLIQGVGGLGGVGDEFAAGFDEFDEIACCVPGETDKDGFFLGEGNLDDAGVLVVVNECASFSNWLMFEVWVEEGFFETEGVDDSSEAVFGVCFL